MNEKKSYILDQIIKEVDKAYYKNNYSKEDLVFVDSKGLAHQTELPLFAGFSDNKYFLFDTEKVISFKGYLCTLMSNSGVTNIFIEYKVKCQVKDIGLLASHSFDLNKFKTFPNDIIQNEVEEFDKTNSLFVDFYGKIKNLENQVILKLKEFGLTALLLSLKLENEEAMSSFDKISISIGMFKVSLNDTSLKATLGLNAEIKTSSGQEILATKNKISKDNIEDKLVEITRNLVSGISAEALFNEYNYSIKDKVAKEINSYLRLIGRELHDFSIILKKNGSLEPIKIIPVDYISVSVKNSYQKWKLKYYCELIAVSNRQAAALLFPAIAEDINEVIADQIKNTISSSVSVEQLKDKLNTEVSNLLAKDIDSRIFNWGRKVNILELEVHYEYSLPDYHEINGEIICLTSDGYTLTVKYTLLLQRNFSSPKYVNAIQIKDIENWGKNETSRLAKTFVLKRSYNDLRFGYNDSELRTQLAELLEEIGFTINQLIVLPEFKMEDHRERFFVDYKDYNINSKIDGIPVAISIKTEALISDFSKIKKILNPKELVEDNAERAIDNKIRQFFHSVDPDRFYTRFNSIDTALNEEKTLEEEIKAIIIKLLKDEYGAEIISLSINPLNTKLVIRRLELQQGPFLCEFSDRSGQFHYNINISVLSIDPMGWPTFKVRDFKLRSEDENDQERNAISQHIILFMQDYLNTSLIPALKKGIIQNYVSLIDKMKEAFPVVCNEVRENFGLIIKIHGPYLIDPKLEEKGLMHNENQKKMYQDYLKANSKRLNDLYSQRSELEKDLPMDAPRLISIKKEIAEIEKEMNSSTIKSLTTGSLQYLLGEGNENTNENPDEKGN